jgi:hypothetical protein
MPAFFAAARRHFAAIQAHYAEDNGTALCAEARALANAAAAVGARGIRDAAIVLARGGGGGGSNGGGGGGGGATRRGGLDELELKIDAADAIWRSAGLIV